MLFGEGKAEGIWIIEPAVHNDSRGFFMESWLQREFEQNGLFYDFVQENHSGSSQKGTLRGIHFQKGDLAQAKLVRCIRGAVLNAAVDLRPQSPTYMQYETMILSAENRRMILMPRGFGHGILTLTDDAEYTFLTDNPYDRDASAGIRWNDPDLGIDWGTDDPVLSEKDRTLSFFKDAITGYF